MSGYVNRLQTIASASILAKQYGARLSICWIPFNLAPSPAEAIFDGGFCDEFVTSEDHASDLLGLRIDEIPLYVNCSRGVASLRGADRGEQALMSELSRVVKKDSPRALTIVSGGSFFQESPDFALNDFRRAKSDFYRTLPLHPDIQRGVDRTRMADPVPYLGLHLRYTDRSGQAPFDTAIRKALLSQSEMTSVTSVFVAADSTQSRDRWIAVCHELGLSPWFVDHPSIDREDPLSAHAALIDWALLGNAFRLIYFSASSFASEAAVMSGSWNESSGLDPNQLRAACVRVSEYGQAGMRRIRKGWR
jgi:hypothetical protein